MNQHSFYRNARVIAKIFVAHQEEKQCARDQKRNLRAFAAHTPARGLLSVVRGQGSVASGDAGRSQPSERGPVTSLTSSCPSVCSVVNAHILNR